MKIAYNMVGKFQIFYFSLGKINNSNNGRKAGNWGNDSKTG